MEFALLSDEASREHTYCVCEDSRPRKRREGRQKLPAPLDKTMGTPA